MRDLGNTVIVVEHDEETIRSADWVIDLGPGAGLHGGRIVAEGPPEELERFPESLTAKYLSGERAIPIPERRRAGSGKALVVRGAREHNLKDIDVRFPLGVMTAVTGVSGSGKSTLVNDILYRALSRALHGGSEKPGAHDKVEGIFEIDKVINIDQAPIGRTPRSNPATYTNVFNPIRELMSRTPEARARGYQPGRFSFNVKGGRCEACAGDGQIKIEMHFLPDIYVTCDVCGGKRYNRETLQVHYKGKSIADILALTAEQALEVFENVPPVANICRTLVEVGLGYIQLGQSSTTLSGGEAQRVKLARELARRSTGRTLYLLDEPTTGLHFDDIQKLLGVLRLADGEGQHGDRHRAQPGGHPDRGLGHRPRVPRAATRAAASSPRERPRRWPTLSASHTGQFLRRMLGAARSAAARMSRTLARRSVAGLAVASSCGAQAAPPAPKPTPANRAAGARRPRPSTSPVSGSSTSKASQGVSTSMGKAVLSRAPEREPDLDRAGRAAATLPVGRRDRRGRKALREGGGTAGEGHGPGRSGARTQVALAPDRHEERGGHRGRLPAFAVGDQGRRKNLDAEDLDRSEGRFAGVVSRLPKAPRRRASRALAAPARRASRLAAGRRLLDSGPT